MKYNIGDHPVFFKGSEKIKKIFNNKCEIIGIYKGDMYHNIHISGTAQDIIPYPWDSKFPGWREKLIYMLKFTEPQYEEFTPQKFRILAIPEDQFNRLMVPEDQFTQN